MICRRPHDQDSGKRLVYKHSVTSVVVTGNLSFNITTMILGAHCEANLSLPILLGKKHCQEKVILCKKVSNSQRQKVIINGQDVLGFLHRKAAVKGQTLSLSLTRLGRAGLSKAVPPGWYKAITDPHGLDLRRGQ